MNEPQRTPEPNLTDSGKHRRQQILQGLKLELGKNRTKRRRRKTVVRSVTILILAGGIGWLFMPNNQLDEPGPLTQNPKITSIEPLVELPQHSPFRPQVVRNRDGIEKMLVASHDKLKTTQVEFLSVKTEELNELLAESGKKFVVGRIGGELRVLFTER